MPGQPRTHLSYWMPRLLVLAAVTAQLFFIHRAYTDPHKYFGFQPYNESDTIRATIVRVTASGRRIPVTRPFFGYKWHTLVRLRTLKRIHRRGHATAGARSVIALLDASLDWVADHTPRDRETLYYYARVSYFHNTRGPYVVELESKRRDIGPAPMPEPGQ